MRGKTLLVLAGLLGAGLVGYHNLPPHLNPLAPLALDDPPGAYRQPAGGRQRGKLPSA